MAFSPFLMYIRKIICLLIKLNFFPKMPTNPSFCQFYVFKTIPLCLTGENVAIMECISIMDAILFIASNAIKSFFF